MQVITRTRAAAAITAVVMIVGDGCTKHASRMTENEKVLYALGLAQARAVQIFRLTPSELAIVRQGLIDGVRETPELDLDQYRQKIEALSATRKAAVVEDQHKQGATYLVKAATEPGAIVLPSGSVLKVIQAGNAKTPHEGNTVKLHFQVARVDGKVVDSSVGRGQPLVTAFAKVPRCWREGLELTGVGGKSRLVCPAQALFGAADRQGPPGTLPGATLVFDLQLLDVEQESGPGKPLGDPSRPSPTVPSASHSNH